MVSFRGSIGTLTLVVATFIPTQNVYAQRKPLEEACYKALHDPNVAEAELQSLCPDRYLRVVVSATRAERELLDAPAAISTVDASEIQRSGATSIADAVRDVPGVEISDAGEVGLKRIRIRGEESRRVAVLIDGQEFLDQREVGTPILIAPEQIERIEVLRGSASVLYGSRAIGGVINIITKKGGFHRHQVTASSQYSSATNGFQNFASIFGGDMGWEYRASASKADHNDRHTPNGDIENTAFENDSLSTFLAKSIGNHRVALGWDIYNASSDVYVDPVVAKTPPFLDFRIDAPERDREKFWGSYDWTDVSLILKRIHMDVYSQGSDRRFDTFSDTTLPPPLSGVSNSSIYTSSLLKTIGTNLQFDIIPSEQHVMVAGLQLIDDELDQDRVRNVLINAAPKPSELVRDQVDQARYGAFVQDEWFFHPLWSLTLGARGDRVDSELKQTDREGLMPESSSDSRMSASAALTHKPSEDSAVWFRWAQGFVYPSPVNLGTGAFAGSSFVNPNSDLEPETSNSFELGGRVFSGNWNFDSAVFLTQADDYIDHVLCSSVSVACIQPTGTRDRVYVNVGQALTYGAEATLSYQFTGVTPYGSATLLRRRFERSSEITTYDTGLPGLAGRIGVKAETGLGEGLLGWADAYVRAESDSSELEDNGSSVEKAGWGTVNLAFGVDIGKTKKQKVVLELSNLGDKKYTSSTENVLGEGRAAMVKVILGL